MMSASCPPVRRTDTAPCPSGEVLQFSYKEASKANKTENVINGGDTN